jgi:desulfoferrodoxin (superoxide reductase-like protein)
MSQSSNWVKVYESPDAIHTELLNNYLITEHQLPAVVLNKKDSSYLYGRCEIHVMAESEEIAKIYISQFDALPKD